MSKGSVLTLERFNSIGFAILYFLSTHLETLLLFVCLRLVSAISDGMPTSFYLAKQKSPDYPSIVPTTSFEQLVFVSIGMFLLTPVVIYSISVALRRNTSTKLFALITFIVSAITHIQIFPGFFTQHHHLANPPFYLFVGVYLLLITGTLTYLWKKLILKNVRTDIPWKTYVVSAFIFPPLFYFFITSLIDSTFIPLGDYLFRHFVINIFFLDWSGYFSLWLTMSALGTLVAVTKLIQKYET